MRRTELHVHRRRLHGLAALVWLALPGCQASEAVPAAVGLGAAVAVAGVNRAITHDCWARCSPGEYCDQESGRCEQGECFPPCRQGQSCVRNLKDRLICVDDPGTFTIGPSASTRSSSPSADPHPPGTDREPRSGHPPSPGSAGAAQSEASDPQGSEVESPPAHTPPPSTWSHPPPRETAAEGGASGRVE